MPWTQDIVRMLSREEIIEYLAEVLDKMGFRNHEKVADRSRWGVDIVAVRDDPLAGTEKLLIKVHTGSLASSKEVSVFGDLIDRYKADRGILISPLGFTKDARTVVAKEYRARIILWDAEKLAKTFSNYGIKVPEIKPQESEEKVEETPLTKFELDAPLLSEFSSEGVLKAIAREASRKYPIKPADIKLSFLKVYLSTAYIISWSAREGESEEKGKALVFSEEKIVSQAQSDPKLATPVKKAILNDRSEIYATEREIESPLSPSEAVLLLKNTLSEKLGLPESNITIHDRKKVYVPTKAEAELKVGANRARAVVDLNTNEVKLDVSELPDEYFLQTVTKILGEKIGEDPLESKIERSNGKVKVFGKTERFNFEFKFNGYTGAVVYEESLITDEALRDLISSTYPDGTILNIEKGKKVAIVEVGLKEGIVILEVNLENGELKEITTLPSPEEAFKKAKPIIENNFPVENLKLVSSRVLEHKFLEITMEGEGGKATAKIDGDTKDVLDYFVEITPQKAEELVLAKYPGYRRLSVSESDDVYTVEIENDEHKVTVKVTKDGKILEEADRVLKKEVAEKIAAEKVKGIDETAEIKGVRLDGDWIVEFQGSNKVGKLVLDRKTGEVKEEDVRFTELALEEAFQEHLKKLYGETELKTERLTHYKEEGYIHIKVAGKNSLYYARIDTKTGKILSEDRAPIKGITAKLKQLQLESKYK